MEENQDKVPSEYEKKKEEAWKLFNEGRLKDCKLKVKTIVQKFSENFGSYELMGHILMEERDIEGAINQFKLAIQKDKDNRAHGFFYYWIAKAHDRGGPFDQFPGSQFDTKKRDLFYEKAKQSGTYPEQLLFDYRVSNSQDREKFLWEGIKRFPNSTDLYLLAASHYAPQGLVNQQVSILQEAIDKGLSSTSLFYRFGELKLMQKELATALQYFEKCLEINADPDEAYGINYQLGNTWFSIGNLEKAEAYYKIVYEEGKHGDNKMFGLFGLLKAYNQRKDQIAIQNLLTNWHVSESSVNRHSRITGGPLYLDSKVIQSIETKNLRELYDIVSKLRSNPKDVFYTGKLNLLKSYLATLNERFYDAHKFITNASKYLNHYHYGFLEELRLESISDIINNKFDSVSERKKAMEILKNEFETYGESKLLKSELKDAVDLFYQDKEYKSIVTLTQHLSFPFLHEADVIFEAAFSQAKECNDQLAKSLYEYYLRESKENTAVLNNLGILYKKEGNIQKAIELYQQGLAIDPTDKHLKDNFTQAKEVLASEERKAQANFLEKQKMLKAIEILQKENDFVLAKLATFIEQVKLEPEFDDWRFPLPRYKFHTLLKVDRQKGEALREQWLTKGYITDTGDRGGYNITVYSVNPYLEGALKGIQKLKIPDKWIKGFININIAALESVGYFDLMDRIEKINKKFQPLIERDFNELVHNYLMGHDKATIVLSGSLVELLLTYYCERRKELIISFKDKAGNSKIKKLYDCVLSDLIDYVELTKPFGNDFVHLSNLSRIYRNYIHPGRELKGSLDSTKADLCFVSTCEIIKRIA